LPQHRLLDANMLTFSGGMQQKAMLARWLVLDPRLLLLDEPTRGVDIGTRSSIYALLRRIAAQGVACVVVSSDFEEVVGLADRIVVLSDGTDVTDIPARLVDIEKLTMFAAPRSSAERTHSVLASLVQETGGVAYWIALEGDRVYCFDRVGDDPAADPGFAGGGFPRREETMIPAALREPTEQIVRDGTRQTLLSPIRGRRGHSLGLVGLTVAGRPGGFDPSALCRRIQATLSVSAEAA
ncbi:MAG TPA: ATP-binding cassette domain-containing protein, partial [Acetobacteraceae bacterium]|nr:ATP-binding cassette domain-containing protein [Acetobacteraceae bacterium]